jgi:propionyl-CoA carboxylase alpha chain
MRTAREMGISTVAIYADSDAQAPFVAEADTAIALNGRTSTETYLDIGKVLDACKRSGADAVHPGYGFLSENAGFAQAIIDAGINWIGPSPKVIGAMGDKLAAKRLMEEAGVPTLTAIEITDEIDLVEAANRIGYPVLVKASAGGGGRGMRVVESPDELPSSVESAKREAGSSFGDDTVFLEKWLSKVRHVEVQIIGDKHGNLVHCFERECSIQRRHQKLIEETPSPSVTQAIRDAMGKAAVSAARNLGYSSAGTVEFLLAGDDFYFLEVNARLQVEHPITEEIIGRDLVREQIRIAEGEELSFRQEDLSISGHAIEARVCAEDPDNNFLPSPGKVVIWKPSRQGNARFDSGVESGSVIAMEFDPLLAKVIVHAPTRREASNRLARVLETTQIQGLTTNRDFLVATLRHPSFVSGDTTTDFIERVNPARKRIISEPDLRETMIAVVMESQARNRAASRVMKSVRSGWRNTILPFESMQLEAGGGRYLVEYRSRRDGRFRVRFDNETNELLVTAFACGNGVVDIGVDGKRASYRVERCDERWFAHGSSGDLTLIEVPRYPNRGAGEIPGGLVAPMPGIVISTYVHSGDSVSKGDLLLVLEAMKMEHRITASRDGIVAALHVEKGQQVKNGQLLVTINEEG